MYLRRQEHREIPRPSTFLNAQNIRWPTGKSLSTSINIFLTKIYAVLRDSKDYKGIFEKAGENNGLIKAVVRSKYHASLRERLLKQREDSHPSRSDFESLSKETRSAALDLENRGRTNLPEDQVTHQQMSHTPLNNKGGLHSRGHGRDRPPNAPQQRGGRGRGIPVPAWQNQRSDAIPPANRGRGVNHVAESYHSAGRGDGGIRGSGGRISNQGHRGRSVPAGGERGGSATGQVRCVNPPTRPEASPRSDSVCWNNPGRTCCACYGPSLEINPRSTI